MSETDRQKILAIMRENARNGNACLATCDGDQPRTRPIAPIVEEDMSLWIMTSGRSRKVSEIRRNPKVCLTFVELPRGDRSATVLGEAQVVTDVKEKKRLWGLAPYDPSEHFPEGPESDDLCLLKVVAKEIEWREDWTSEENVYRPPRG